MAMVELQKSLKLETTNGLKISNKPEKMKFVSKTSQLKYFRLHTMVCQGRTLTARVYMFCTMKHSHGVHSFAELCLWDKIPVPALHIITLK